MLTIVIPSVENYDESTNEFTLSKAQTIQLEHSLVSISKWETKWGVPFLSKNEKTVEQTTDYIRCMVVTQNVDDKTIDNLTSDMITTIKQYIDSPMSASTLPVDTKKSGVKETVTSELIYYWMVSLTIPFECQKWHLNRLLTLINICNIKNAPPKKMGKKELLNRNASLNAQRKEELRSKG